MIESRIKKIIFSKQFFMRKLKRDRTIEKTLAYD